MRLFNALAISLLLSFPVRGAACPDLTFDLKDQFLSPFIHDAARYMLSSIVGDPAAVKGKEAVTHLPCLGLPDDQLLALQAIAAEVPYGFKKLRDATTEFYNANRSLHHQMAPIPAT